MADPLLQSLREQIIDESQPLAGLLRKCLLLGAQTGSDSLRQWARFELNGYEDDADLPAYRLLPTPPISVDSVSGYTWSRGRMFDRLQLPTKAQAFVGEDFPLRQPIEELEALAEKSSLSFTSPALAYAQALWNEELETPFQQIIGMSFQVPGSLLRGVLGQVRTQLVDVIAELVADSPLTELPGKEKVDAAVGAHIGTQYNTTIHAAHGPTAIGRKATTAVEGFSVEDALKLLDAVRGQAEAVGVDGRDELVEAVEALREEVRRGERATTGEVVKKAGRLKQVTARVGGAGLVAATTGAVEAITNLAMSGAFG